MEDSWIAPGVRGDRSQAKRRGWNKMDPASRGRTGQVQPLEILRAQALAIRGLTSGKPECG
jgi:hypothetical protein